MSKDPIVEGPEPGPIERLRDGFGRSVRPEPAPELTIGTPQAAPTETAQDPELADLARMEAREAAERANPPPPAAEEDAGLISISRSWKLWVIGPVVLAFALLHIAPHLADWAGEPRAELARLAVLPFGDTLRNAAAGWLWEPLWVALGAMALRLRALQRMFRDPPGAIMMALIATVFEGAFWIFMGLKHTGAYSPAEASALILLLKIEGGAMLGLFCLFAPLGKRRLAETDAHWNRG
jgi:hypothetical protein